MQGYTPTPNYDDYLAHYGVKGMRWRKRKKANLKSTTHDKSRIKNRLVKTGMPVVERRDLQLAAKYGGGTSPFNTKEYRDRMNRGAKFKEDKETGKTVVINPWGSDGSGSIDGDRKRRSSNPGTRSKTGRFRSFK